MPAYDIQINPYEPCDFREVVSLLSRELHADIMFPEIFQRKVLLDANFRPKGALVAKYDGKVIGFILALLRKYPLEDAAPDFDRGWITLIAVDKSHQRRDIGSMLLDSAMNYLESGGAASVWVSPYAPNYFTPGIDEAAYPGAIEFFHKHGFETAYRPLSMESSPLDPHTPDWVVSKETGLQNEGLIFDTFKPEYILPLLDFLKREFPGDWQRLMRESMVRITEGTFSPDQISLAMESGECVGFCRHDGERFGPFGVARVERGRGIGAILLFRCLQGMKEKGLSRAWFAWTDDNAANLYALAGFHETRRFSVMKRGL